MTEPTAGLLVYVSATVAIAAVGAVFGTVLSDTFVRYPPFIPLWHTPQWDEGSVPRQLSPWADSTVAPL
jgi:hypothetical protein